MIVESKLLFIENFCVFPEKRKATKLFRYISLELGFLPSTQPTTDPDAPITHEIIVNDEIPTPKGDTLAPPEMIKAN